VPVPREQTFSHSDPWLKRGKVYLEDCGSRRHFPIEIDGKDMVLSGFIPVLVFDCVPLHLREGISGLFSDSDSQ